MRDFKYFADSTLLQKSDFEIAHFIDCGISDLSQFKSPQAHLQRLGDPEKPLQILDFGCGIGRNCVGMLAFSKKWKIVGYDNSIMLQRGLKFYEDKLRNPRLNLFSDWDAIVALKNKEQKSFDTIFCCLVLQHIDQAQLEDYLIDFKKLTSRLFVCGRRGLDENWSTSGYTDVWQVIQACGFKPEELEEGLSTGKDPNDHHYGIFKI